MVIGNSFLARKFNSYLDNDNVVIFADGVINSREGRFSEFNKEKKLLLRSISDADSGSLFVYFSTCSVYDPDEQNSAYVKHKLLMEEIVCKHSNKFLIVRKAQLVGDLGDKNSVLNYFVNSVFNNKEFFLWKNAHRNLIDIDDFYVLTDYLIKNEIYKNTIVNIANKDNMPVVEIIKVVEMFLDRKAKYHILNKGCNYVINIDNIEPYLEICNVLFKKTYTNNLLEKYYSDMHK